MLCNVQCLCFVSWASVLSWFLQWHSAGRVRMWQKHHESMDPSCLILVVQTGVTEVWGMACQHEWTHLHMGAYNRIMCRATKLRTGFLNMTSLLDWDLVTAETIRVQWSAFGMWLNGRWTSWMFNQQIYCSCLMLLCQYRPTSLGNASSTLNRGCSESKKQIQLVLPNELTTKYNLVSLTTKSEW